jgi:hypothetical protein
LYCCQGNGRVFQSWKGTIRWSRRWTWGG